MEPTSTAACTPTGRSRDLSVETNPTRQRASLLEGEWHNESNRQRLARGLASLLVEARSSTSRTKEADVVKRAGVAVILVIGVIVPFGDVLAAGPVAGQPAGVSPGDAARFTGTESRCPTFAWTAVEGADEYDLRVYAVDGARTDPTIEPVLRMALPAGATAWTPPTESCLQRGGRYAWSLRAVTAKRTVTAKDDSPWSVPLLFEVAALATSGELAPALEIVGGRLDRPEPVDVEMRLDGDSRSLEPGRAPVGGSAVQGAPLPIPAGSAAAAIKVDGEVRTVTPDGSARLWGRGRTTEVFGTIFGGVLNVPCSNGSIQYGLSTTDVAWGAAAEACPAGTWVCRGSDIGPDIACNTTRTDDGIDLVSFCNNSIFDLPEDGHIGWLAETLSGSSPVYGLAQRETGGPVSWTKCWFLPVWCCWE